MGCRRTGELLNLLRALPVGESDAVGSIPGFPAVFRTAGPLF